MQNSVAKKKKINHNLPIMTTIDTKIKDLCQLIHNLYRIAIDNATNNDLK